jgi:glycosyltransferase involved in cell wall biosynthesis
MSRHYPRADPRIRVSHLISNSHRTEYFRLMARHTDHARFAIEVGSLESPGDLQDGLAELGVPTYELAADRRSRYALATARLAARLRRERVEVLHTHLFEASLVGLTAARLARTPLAVFTGHHSHEVPLHRRRLLLALDRFAAKHLADVVVSPSQEMKDTFVQVYGCPSAKVEVIEHGVDLQRFDPARVDGSGVRAELELEGRLVFGAISKHFWVKNVEALVRGFASVSDEVPEAHLVILGIGDREPTARLVRELRLDPRVTLLAPRVDVPEVLAAFDVFVHPALAESFGLAVVEAMAMQLPVVATPVGIARDVIEDGLSGIQIYGTDPVAIAESMHRVLAARRRWSAIGVEARRRVLGFTPQRWVKAHESLYQRRLGA